MDDGPGVCAFANVDRRKMNQHQTHGFRQTTGLSIMVAIRAFDALVDALRVVPGFIEVGPAPGVSAPCLFFALTG